MAGWWRSGHRAQIFKRTGSTGRDAGLVEPSDHIAALEREGSLLAAAACHRGLGAAVPACPGWQMRELVRHLGYVHRWAAGYVGQARREMASEPPESQILQAGPADPDLLGWFRDGLDELVRALRSADPALECWTFLDAPSPLAFWARRQAHETAIHRADAEGAAGDANGDGVTSFPAAFAADGLDELLTGFAPRARFSAGSDAAASAQSMIVRAADSGDEWITEIGARITARHSTAPAQDPQYQSGEATQRGLPRCIVAGTASDLYLMLWNRQRLGDRVTVSGDVSALELWQARVRVTW
jgi:uncharacterized protein (TIGR03083 family)